MNFENSAVRIHHIVFSKSSVPEIYSKQYWNKVVWVWALVSMTFEKWLAYRGLFNDKQPLNLQWVCNRQAISDINLSKILPKGKTFTSDKNPLKSIYKYCRMNYSVLHDWRQTMTLTYIQVGDFE